MTDLIKRDAALEAKSLKDMVRDLTDNPFFLIDTSGSMADAVDPRERGGKRCIDALREVVTEVLPTGQECPMIAFGGPYGETEVRFVHAVPEPDGGTPLAQAIELANEYGATRLVVISDGIPNDRNAAMAAAQAFAGRIDVFYVGAPGSEGEVFLKHLAAKSGGEQFTGSLKDTKLVAGKVLLMLSGEVEEKATIIQGEGFSSVAPVEEEPEDEEDFDDEDDEDDEDDDDEDDDDK